MSGALSDFELSVCFHLYNLLCKGLFTIFIVLFIPCGSSFHSCVVYHSAIACSVKLFFFLYYDLNSGLHTCEAVVLNLFWVFLVFSFWKHCYECSHYICPGIMCLSFSKVYMWNCWIISNTFTDCLVFPGSLCLTLQIPICFLPHIFLDELLLSHCEFQLKYHFSPVMGYRSVVDCMLSGFSPRPIKK